mmetsp:Transcript_5405/g.15691  ORF Transcript_5405/g.15691 Transcript_5405/m.15691 type:complete len:483 (+) Transcript_5405:235-1683(+)
MRSLSLLFAIRAASTLGGGRSHCHCLGGSVSVSVGVSAFGSTSTISSSTIRSSSSSSSTARSMTTSAATPLTRAQIAERLTGLPIGPYPVGVTTIQIAGDPKRGRGLQTEIWYPADESAKDAPPTKYSEYLGLDTANDPEAALAAANAPSAIGGYRDGITVAELDDEARSTWLTTAVRNAKVAERSSSASAKFPLVLFSHGSGAYRASYGFWTEFLASHGYVVAACDHPGSARYTIVDGEVITPGGPRSKRKQMEIDRPADLIQILDGLEELGNSNRDSNRDSNSDVKNPLFRSIDTKNVAITGMSFGGFTTAMTLELKDPRVRAGVMMCSSMALSGTQDYHLPSRTNKETPVMVIIGTEDTVLGRSVNDANRQYVDNHSDGDAYLLELVRGGHVSFTSCELYDPEYGNGINAKGESKRLTEGGAGGTYKPWDICKQHGVVNHYGLRFLDRYLKEDETADVDLETNPFDPAEVLYRSNTNRK